MSGYRERVGRWRRQWILKRIDNSISQTVGSIKTHKSKSLNLLEKDSESLIFMFFFLSSSFIFIQKLRTSARKLLILTIKMIGSPLSTSISPCLHPISPVSKHLGMPITLNYSPKDLSATSTHVCSPSKWKRPQAVVLPLYPTEGLENGSFHCPGKGGKNGDFNTRRPVTAFLVLWLICCVTSWEIT